MKALFKNKIFLATAAVVLVSVIAVTAILLLPKTEAIHKGNESNPADISAADPAGLDVADMEAGGTAGTSSITGTTSPEHGNYTGPSAAEVEDGTKVPPKSPTAPPDKIESGTKPTEKPKEDSVQSGGVDTSKDYTPEDGSPHFGVPDDTYPEPDSPNVDGNEQSVDDFIEGTDRPGEGVPF